MVAYTSKRTPVTQKCDIRYKCDKKKNSHIHVKGSIQLPSQCLPLVPGGHSQSYSPAPSSLHLASFLQGFGWQGCGISEWTERDRRNKGRKTVLSSLYIALLSLLVTLHFGVAARSFAYEVLKSAGYASVLWLFSSAFECNHSSSK